MPSKEFSYNAGQREWQGAPVDRRKFLKGVVAGAGAVAITGAGPIGLSGLARGAEPELGKPPYQGPNVILIRFGGGVRRLETINPAKTYSPFFCHELVQRGTFFPNMEIAQLDGVETSHGQGTLYILTGKYDHYKDVNDRFLGDRFEAKVPTLFEYLRKEYDIPEHQALIINGEDRIDEEFYTFSNHHLFGVRYRSVVLSLYRFKTYLLRSKIEQGVWSGAELEKKRQELHEMVSLDYRTTDRSGAQPAPVEEFWERWRGYYGESGFVNPRGDRLLTELALRAIRELRPRLMMVNYNDPDYVHWGNMTHYTRGVAIIDEGIQRIVAAVDQDEEYRDNTIFAIVPDCGRDSNPFNSVPCQHHFNSRSSREVFALLLGKGIPRGVVVDRLTQQIDVAPTLSRLMDFRVTQAEGSVLEEAIA